jgi:2-keto-4-pentenoate hydratase/2-oxohepta-3-ene-1,7-dioic acid hydratase in catechol pathway
MKLVRYLSGSSPEPRWGVVEDAYVKPLADDPLKTVEVLDGRELLTDVRLLAPCRPAKIVGLAINYPNATGMVAGMEEPLVFLKSPTSVIGPGEKIVSPFPGMNIWGEPELAIVMRKQLRNASEEEARNAILGYTIGNDVSADNLHGWDHHLARSKAADCFCPMGPWIDTEFRPAAQKIEGYHNGELIRRGRLDERLWGDTRTLAWLSSWMTLEPWDVVLTGTPSRVVPRRYFSNGDEFMARIEGLGDLPNSFESRIP